MNENKTDQLRSVNSSTCCKNDSVSGKNMAEQVSIKIRKRKKHMFHKERNCRVKYE